MAPPARLYRAVKTDNRNRSRHLSAYRQPEPSVNQNTENSRRRQAPGNKATSSVGRRKNARYCRFAQETRQSSPSGAGGNHQPRLRGTANVRQATAYGNKPAPPGVATYVVR